MAMPGSGAEQSPWEEQLDMSMDTMDTMPGAAFAQSPDSSGMNDGAAPPSGTGFFDAADAATPEPFEAPLARLNLDQDTAAVARLNLDRAVQLEYYFPGYKNVMEVPLCLREALHHEGNDVYNARICEILAACTEWTAWVLSQGVPVACPITSSARWNHLRKETPVTCTLAPNKCAVLPGFARLVVHGQVLPWRPLDTLFNLGHTVGVSVLSAMPDNATLSPEVRVQLQALEPRLRQRYGVGLNDPAPLLQITYDQSGNVWGRRCVERNVYFAARDTLAHALPGENNTWCSLQDRETLFHTFRFIFETGTSLETGVRAEDVQRGARAGVIVIPLLPEDARLREKGSFREAFQRGPKEKQTPYGDMPLCLEILPASVFSVFVSRYVDPKASTSMSENDSAVFPMQLPASFDDDVSDDQSADSAGGSAGSGGGPTRGYENQCPFCNTTQQRIVRHLRTVHPERRLYPCRNCGSSTLSPRMRDRHERQCRARQARLAAGASPL